MNLRPHEEEYRDDQTMTRLGHLSLMVCGCGALGGHYALAMARMGVAQFTLVDREPVGSENMGSQPYFAVDVGLSKTGALAVYLGETDPVQSFVEISLFNEDVLKTTKPVWEIFPHHVDLVIDAFDNHDARAWVADQCGELEIPCLHLGMIGNFGSVIWNDRYTVPQDLPDLPDNCAHPFSLSLVYRITSAAIESTCTFVQDYETKVDYRIRGMEIERYGS